MSLPINRNLFKEFPNRVLVETGSYRGDGIQAAIEAGFEKIISIDVDGDNIDFCHSRFDLVNFPDKPITLIHGDSAECLWDTIKDIKEPITFWLDAHWQMLEFSNPGKNPFPLLKELAQIQKHPIKIHTIIIDDWHIFYKDIVGYGKEDVKRAIKQINPNYDFINLSNPVIDGILVAYV